MKQITDKRTLVGYVGEVHVMHQLAMLGVITERLPTTFDCDLITHRGVLVEVKSSRPTMVKSSFLKKDGTKTVYKKWQFIDKQDVTELLGNNVIKRTQGRRLESRRCDFYAFVCFEESGFEATTYIVPSSVMSNCRLKAISQTGNDMYAKYREKWELIVDKGGIGREVDNTDKRLDRWIRGKL